MPSRAAVVAKKPASVIKKRAAVVAKKPASVIKKYRAQFEQGDIVLRAEFQDTEYANGVFACVVNKQQRTATMITQLAKESADIPGVITDVDYGCCRCRLQMWITDVDYGCRLRISITDVADVDYGCCRCRLLMSITDVDYGCRLRVSITDVDYGYCGC